ncbi:MAG: hypothetical protein R6X33_11585 [Candidatus Brocadiia bacterium]
MKKLVAAFLILALSTANALGQPAWDKVPEDVTAAVEVRDMHSLGPRLQQAVMRISPMFMIPPPGPTVTSQALKTHNYVSVDLEAPFRIIVLAPPLHETPVTLYRVNDPALYIDSLFQNIEQEKVEDGIHHLREQRESYDPTMDSPGEGRPLYIGFAGQTAAMGRKLEAVRTAVTMLKEGNLPAEPLFEADAGAMVRLGKLMQRLEETGQDPFAGFRAAMAQMPLQNPRQRAAMETNIRMVEAFVDQTEALSAECVLQESALVSTFALKPVAGGGIERFLAEIPGGNPGLMKHLPGGAIVAFDMRMGGMEVFMDWMLDQWRANLGEEAEGNEPLQRMVDAMESWASVQAGGFAVALYGERGAPVTAAEVFAVDDPEKAQAAIDNVMGSMDALAEMGAQPGFRFSTEEIPDVPSHGGRDISGWRMHYQFEAAAGLPPNVVQMQRASIETMWGGEPTTYTASADNRLLLTMGGEALERLKTMIDGPSEPLSESGVLAEALADMPDGAVAEGFIVPGRFADWYVGVMDSMMQPMGFPLPLANMRFAPGPPVGFAVYVDEAHVVRNRVRLPFGSLTVLVQGVMTGMQQPQTRPAPSEQGPTE